jgi:hypothetical protein
MGTQRFEENAIRALVAAESGQEECVKPLFLRLHGFLFTYSWHLGIGLQRRSSLWTLLVGVTERTAGPNFSSIAGRVDAEQP